jgi:hypothetical protein
MPNYPWDNQEQLKPNIKTQYPWDETVKVKSEQQPSKIINSDIDAIEAQRLSVASSIPQANVQPVKSITGMPSKAEEYETRVNYAPTPATVPQMSYADFKKQEYNIPKTNTVKPYENRGRYIVVDDKAEGRTPGIPAKEPSQKVPDNQPSWGKTVGSSLLGGVAQTNASMFNVPRKIIEGVSIGLDKVLPDFIYNKEMQNNDPIKKALDKAVKSNEERAMQYQKDLEGAKGIKGFVAAGLPALPQIVMAAFGGAAASGSSALSGLPTVAKQLIPFGTLAAGGYAKEAENDGASYGQQVAYGLLGGTAEAATEVIPLGNALNLMKKFGAGDIAEKGAKTLVGKYGKTAMQIIGAKLSEGLQEAIMSPIGKGAKKLTYDQDMKWTGKDGVVDWKDIKDSFYGGISMAVILGGLALPSTYAAHKLAAGKIESEEAITPDFIQNELMPALQKDTAAIENESNQAAKIQQAPAEFNWALNQVISGKNIPHALEKKYPVLVEFRNNLQTEGKEVQLDTPQEVISQEKGQTIQTIVEQGKDTSKAPIENEIPEKLTYEEYQKLIDAEEDKLIAKYGEERYINNATGTTKDIPENEFSYVNKLYDKRNAIGEQDDKTARDTIVNNLDDVDTKEWVADKDSMDNVLKDMQKETLFENIEGENRTKTLEDIRRKLYNKLIQATGAPEELWGEYDNAKRLAENEERSPFGKSLKPLFKQIDDIINVTLNGKQKSTPSTPQELLTEEKPKEVETIGKQRDNSSIDVIEKNGTSSKTIGEPKVTIKKERYIPSVNDIIDNKKKPAVRGFKTPGLGGEPIGEGYWKNTYLKGTQNNGAIHSDTGAGMDSAKKLEGIRREREALEGQYKRVKNLSDVEYWELAQKGYLTEADYYKYIEPKDSLYPHEKETMLKNIQESKLEGRTKKDSEISFNEWYYRRERKPFNEQDYYKTDYRVNLEMGKGKSHDKAVKAVIASEKADYEKFIKESVKREEILYPKVKFKNTVVTSAKTQNIEQPIPANKVVIEKPARTKVTAESYEELNPATGKDFFTKSKSGKKVDDLKTKLDKLIRDKASAAKIKEVQDELDKMNLQTFAEEEAEQKVSQFYSNSLLNSIFIPEKVKGLLEETDFLYDVQTNEGQLEEAARDIEFNAEQVESSLRKSEAIRSGRESAAALLLTKIKLEEAANIGDYTEALEWITTIRPKITSTAQALQAVSMWKRFTTENVLMQAERTVEEFSTPAQEKRIEDKGKEIDKQFKDAETDAADTLAKEVEQGATEGASEVINGAEKEIRKRKATKKAETDKSDKEPKVTQDEVDQVDPAELLVKKIEFQLKDPTAHEHDFITDMVNELFKVAKESPLPEKQSIKRNPIEFIKQAIENRGQYKEAWLEAKETLKKKYSLDQVTLDVLSDYFEKGINPTFSEKTMDAVLKRYVANITLQKDKRQINPSAIPKLADVVKTYYGKGKTPTVTLVDKIMKEAELSEEDAAILAKHIRNRMHKLTKSKKEEILARVFSEKSLPNPEKKYNTLSELINIGAFKNDLYKQKAQQKLKDGLNAMLKDADINLGELAKASFIDNRLDRFRLLNFIAQKLKVSDKDLADIVDVIANTFDEVVEEKRNKILDNALKMSKVERKKKAFYDKILELYNMGGFEKVQYRHLIAAKLGIPHLTEEDIKKIVNLTERLSFIPEKGLDNLIERETLEMQILAVVQNLVPASLSKKISTIQAIQQLLNIKTFDRNLIGNALMYRADRGAKYLASIIDYGKSKLTGNERQITFRTGKNFQIWNNTQQYWDNISKAAKAAIEGYSLYGYDPAADSKFLNTPANVFKGKWNPATYLHKALSISLGAFDYASYMRGVYDKIGELAYLDGLNKGLNGKDLDDNAKEYIDNIEKEIFEIAKDYGDYVTFKEQDNPIGNAFAGFKDVLNVVGVGRTTGHIKGAPVKEFGLGDIIIKYARTPGILLSRGFEFSPAGILKTMYHVGQAHIAHKRGEPYDSRIITESLARAIFGTVGFTALGFALASIGVISSSPDDNDKANYLAQAMGLGKYKLNVSALFRWFTSGFNKEQAKAHNGDKMYTYDWLQPISMPVSLGANFQKNRLDAGETADTVMKSLEGMFNTITDTTLLQNLFKAFNGMDKMQTFENAVQNALTGFTGTFNNQIRQITDNKMRNAYEGGFLEKTGNLVKNRIPGASKTLPEQVNILGDTKTYYSDNKNIVAKFFDVFINPSIVTEYKSTPGTELIKSLYDKYKETAQIPSEVAKVLTVGDAKVTLTQEEKNLIQKNIGEAVVKDLDKKAANRVFTGMKPEQQVSQIESMIAKKRTAEYEAFRNSLRRKRDERLKKK